MSRLAPRPRCVFGIAVAALALSLGAACGNDSGTVAPASPPLLGHSWAAHQEGYGATERQVIDNGGDPTGRVIDITWESWGDERAQGRGTAVYVPEGAPTAEGEPEPAVIVAFRLGECDRSNAPAYRAVDWYFPDRGEKFDENRYIDACTGDYVGAR